MDDALALVDVEDALFVDVRERAEQSAGAITGAVAAPRGFLEFIADPASPMHNPALSSGKRLIVYCASGGRSALATKTCRTWIRRGREPDRRLPGLERGRRPDRIAPGSTTA